MSSQPTPSRQTRTATRYAILVFACALLPLLGGCPPPIRTWTVMGRVLDVITGDPIADAEVVVCLIWADGECKASDADRTTSDGSFEIPRAVQLSDVSSQLLPIEAQILVRTESQEALFTLPISPGDATLTNDSGGTVRLRDARPELAPRNDISLMVPQNLEGVGLGDVDGDGDQDIIVSTHAYAEGPDSGFVITNSSPGSFSDPAPFESGDSPALVRVIDLNGDNRPDLVSFLFGPSGRDILIQLNDGQGGFASSSVVETNTLSLIDLDVADVNGDGRADLVAVGFANDDVAVFINEDDGDFSPPAFYAVGARPNRLLASDVDLDGDMDLVTSTNLGIAVLFNDAGGQFQSAGVREGDIPLFWSLAVADLDGDGDPDIVSAILDGIAFHRNDGNGSFALPATQDFPFFQDIATGDLDGDGINDLVAIDSEAVLQNVYLLQNDGTGLFQEAARLSTGNDTQAIAVGDLDANTTVDVVVINSSETVSIFLDPLAP